MLQLACEPDTSGEVHHTLQALPDGFDARFAVAFAGKEAAEHRHKRNHLIEARYFIRRGFLFKHEGRAPLIRLEKRYCY